MFLRCCVKKNVAQSAAWYELNAVVCEYVFEFQTMFWSGCVGGIFYCVLFMSIVMNAKAFSFVLIFDMFGSFWMEFSEELDANFPYHSLRGGEVFNLFKNTGVLFDQKFTPL